jgi:hypothetical protein
MSVRRLDRSGSRALCRAVILRCAAVLLCSVLTRAAFADNGDLRKADQLFRSGKQQLAEEDYAHACPLLAESFRLDPATGTLLALAICHERQGKLGSAFREYTEVIARCKAEARPDREQAARERASSLEARLSTLTIKTSNVGELDDLEVRINGARIERARLDKALAVDGGTQTIEASAQGKKPWRTEVRVAKSTDSKIVTIPPLDDTAARRLSQSQAAVPVAPAAAAPAAPIPPAAPAPPPRASELRSAPTLPPPRPIDESSGLSPTQWVGLGAIGTGLIGLGVGTFFTARAVSWDRDSSKGCIGDVCTAAARQDRLDARAAGNAATISFVVGAGLAAAGVSMYLLGQRSTSSAAAAQARLAVGPWAAPHELGGSVRGSF